MAIHSFGRSRELPLAVMVEVSSEIFMQRIYVVGVLVAVCLTGWLYQAPISHPATSWMTATCEYSKAVAEFGGL